MKHKKELLDLLAKYHIEATEENILALNAIAAKRSKGKLSDDALDHVNGGTNTYDDTSYRDDFKDNKPGYPPLDDSFWDIFNDITTIYIDKLQSKFDIIT